MSQDEFNDYIARSDIGDKICFIKLKYAWEKNYRYVTELYLYDPADSLPYSEYCWENDWYKGVEEAEILGCIDVRDVVLLLFNGGDRP